LIDDNGNDNRRGGEMILDYSVTLSSHLSHWWGETGAGYT